MIIPTEFYRQQDVVAVARQLLGKLLVTQINGLRTSGIITETEAYAGASDKASHAFGNRRTGRTEIMYTAGGVAYVYLCYGIHHLFNIVTNCQNVPHAVLIRAIEPAEGIDVMLERRKKERVTPALTSGPGALSEALGIRTLHSGASLQGPEIWLEDTGAATEVRDVVTATRVGVAYAQEDAMLPYRFYLKGNKFVSKAKGL